MFCESTISKTETVPLGHNKINTLTLSIIFLAVGLFKLKTMHPDCKTCKDKRNCINGARCMKCGCYIDRIKTKPCEYE